MGLTHIFSMMRHTWERVELLQPGAPGRREVVVQCPQCWACSEMTVASEGVNNLIRALPVLEIKSFSG